MAVVMRTEISCYASILDHAGLEDVDVRVGRAAECGRRVEEVTVLRVRRLEIGSLRKIVSGTFVRDFPSIAAARLLT
jgi:hypothetical protein